MKHICSYLWNTGRRVKKVERCEKACSMFTKKSLIVGSALILAILCGGLIAASAHTVVAPPTKTKQTDYPPFTLVRHIDLPNLILKFPRGDKVPVLGKVLPAVGNLPLVNDLTDGNLLGGPLQGTSDLLNGIFNLGAPSGNQPSGNQPNGSQPGRNQPNKGQR